VPSNGIRLNAVNPIQNERWRRIADKQKSNRGNAGRKTGVRKAFSKLRQTFREAKVDIHVLIVRGGSAACP